MLPEELIQLERFATGPIDAYDVHHVRPLVLKLLQQSYKTLRELAELQAQYDMMHQELLKLQAADQELC